MKKYDQEYQLRKSYQGTLDKIHQKVSQLDRSGSPDFESTRKTEVKKAVIKVKITVQKPMEESTVTATVKNFSENDDFTPVSLETSGIQDIKRLLADTLQTDYRPTIENPSGQHNLAVPQTTGEVALLRSTINTMKKQGYFLTKNQEYMKQENLNLKESNAKLEQLVTMMEHKMEAMMVDTLQTKNKCEKALFNSMVHESILIERIDGLEKLNK